MDHNGFSVQTLPRWRRLVLKVGSSLLAGERGALSPKHVLGLAQFIAASRDAGCEIILVSSGAVSAGRMLLSRHSGLDSSHAARQAMAALGQTQTMALWQRLFDWPLAQVLLTQDDMRNRRRYLNARATLNELMSLGVLPVVNENDTVAVDEWTLGDNDNLAAIVAGLVGADLLLIATDIDGLYDANPRQHADARAINRVDTISAELMAMASGAGSLHGTGGMRTKLEAAKRAASAGIDTLVFNARNMHTVGLLTQGQFRGTHVASHQSRVQARKYWLRNMPKSDGCIRIDQGAVRALASGKASLLPSGVKALDGGFKRGDMVDIVDADKGQLVARGISQYGSLEINRIKGIHSDDIKRHLGYSYGETVVHRDDLVIVDDKRPGTDKSRQPGTSKDGA